jgi:hypothetical protein
MTIVAAVALLLLALIGPVSASPDPWPNWNAAAPNSFPFTVAGPSMPFAGGSTSFAVSVDPGNVAPGWAIKAFVVYVDGLTAQLPQHSTAYDAGNTAGWTLLNGGWEKNKYPGPVNTTAAFGWETGGPSEYLYSGSGAAFNAESLPRFDSIHYAVHAVNPGGTLTFWATEGGGPPQFVPEPGSLLFLVSGMGAALAAFRRRKV